jgi:formamidopyrimidine-DNA glycosylase
MPELPEVETVVRGLRAPLIGHRIESMWYNWENSIATPHPNEFEQRVIGQTVKAISRRAKYIVIELDSDLLLVHLRMTGRLYVAATGEENEADKWVHVKFALDMGKELRFSDSRKFGKVYLVDTLDKVTGALGPEPLEDTFTPEILAERLKKRNKAIKTLLLDQNFLAGVGNIYADEALHRAKIHPARSASSLSAAEIATLYETIRLVLKMGIDHEGASVNWYRKPDGTLGESQNHFLVYGQDGQVCQTCSSTIIEKVWLGQRGTHFCPNCQPKP